ncbi:DUF167 domain-containing protein [Acidobacteria bacterium AH-259-G07]|nr:DUF167 domain-containing protein [Acidobacteria bacterium AH-259-G07]
MKDIKISKKSDTLLLSVRVQTRAAGNEIVGSYNGALKVRLTTPPLKNRANRQLLEFLAKCLNLPPRNVFLVHGQKSKNKTIGVQGLSKEELLEHLTLHMV